MSKADEYVERMVAEGYKRELDQEENVVRSLPFFATSLGVLATALGLARPAICPFALAPFPLAIYAVLALIGIAILLVLLFLFEATRARQFKNPMSERALIGYSERLHEYYDASGRDEATRTEAVLADLREDVTLQLAEAARVTRENNLARLRARGRAVTALVTAIFLAFVLLGLILGRDAGSTGACHVGNPGSGPEAARAEEPARRPDGPDGAEAGASRDAAGRPGRLDLPRSAAPGARP